MICQCLSIISTSRGLDLLTLYMDYTYRWCLITFTALPALVATPVWDARTSNFGHIVCSSLLRRSSRDDLYSTQSRVLYLLSQSHGDDSKTYPARFSYIGLVSFWREHFSVRPSCTLEQPFRQRLCDMRPTNMVPLDTCTREDPILNSSWHLWFFYPSSWRGTSKGKLGLLQKRDGLRCAH